MQHTKALKTSHLDVSAMRPLRMQCHAVPLQCTIARRPMNISPSPMSAVWPAGLTSVNTLYQAEDDRSRGRRPETLGQRED